MSDPSHVLKLVAIELTAETRRYPDGGTATGAHLLARLLLDFAERGPFPDEDVVETFLGVAEKMLSRSTTLH